MSVPSKAGIKGLLERLGKCAQDSDVKTVHALMLEGLTFHDAAKAVKEKPVSL